VAAPTAIARSPLRPSGAAPAKVAPLSGPRNPITAADDPRQLLRTSLNGFELTRLLDEDAFTWIYEGRRAGGRPGAAGGAETASVKVLRPELRGDASEAYLRAGRALVGVDNPHLIRVLAAGVEEGLPYVASELIQAPDIDQLLRAEQPLTIRRAARLGAGLLNALDTAHGREIMHHDLRASRVLVAGDQVKVGDFGVARVFEQLEHTATGYLDPRYASPEQARGDEAGPAADQYVAALLIYKLFTGKLPFSSKTPRGFWTLHVTQPPTPLRDLRPDVPPPLADAIHRGLAKFPEERFPDVGAFEDMLTSFSRM